jgi:photosystem II stability/assembly factor-like uncharacterized protein
VYFRDLKNGWIVGFAGQILHSTDGGVTWKQQSSSVKGWLTSIGFDPANRGWITHDDGFLVTENDGETWKVVNTTGRFFLSRLVRVQQTMWALGQSTLLKQKGAGLEWQRIESLKLDRATQTTVQAPSALSPGIPQE